MEEAYGFYFTMASCLFVHDSFLVVLFFAVTGITLNHSEWFDGKQVEKKYSGVVPVSWVNTPDTTQIKKLEIVELLRNRYGIRGYVSDFLIQDEECSLSFKGPGYSADAYRSGPNTHDLRYIRWEKDLHDKHLFGNCQHPYKYTNCARNNGASKC